MPTIKEKMEKMSTDMQAMEQSIEFVEKNSKEAKTAASGAIKEMEQLKSQVNKLEEELKKEKEMRINLEYEQKRVNLLCSGLPEDIKTAKNMAERNKLIEVALKQKLDIDIVSIARSTVIQTQSSEKKGTCVIMQFSNLSDRERVWANRRNLKGTKMILREDLPHEMSIKVNTLLPIMVEARRQKMKAHIVRDRLYISDKSYTCDNLHTLPPGLQPSNTATKLEENHLFFLSKNTPLSNFHTR